MLFDAVQHGAPIRSVTADWPIRPTSCSPVDSERIDGRMIGGPPSQSPKSSNLPTEQQYLPRLLGGPIFYPGSLMASLTKPTLHPINRIPSVTLVASPSFLMPSKSFVSMIIETIFILPSFGSPSLRPTTQ